MKKNKMKKNKIVAIALFIVIVAASTCSFAYYNEGNRRITRASTQVESSSFVQNRSVRTISTRKIRDFFENLQDKIEEAINQSWRKTQLTEEVLTANNVKFEEKTFTYNGEAHSIEVENLPRWAEVEYENNEITDAGEITVTAKITAKNNSSYRGSVTLTSKITVAKKTLEEQDLTNLGVKFESKTFIYDGNPHDLTAENLPDWVNVQYVSNAKVNPQTAVVTAVITAKEESNYEGTVKIKATLTIEEAPHSLTIALNGEKTLTLQAGSEYTELGSTVVENDVEINANLGPIAIRYYADPTNTAKQEILPSVDTNRIGVYKLIYIYKDSEKNQAVDPEDETKDFAMRTIIIEDTTAPKMTLNGDATITLSVGSEYVEQGATVTDNYDETRTNLRPDTIKYYADPTNTAIQEILKTVDTSRVGVYKLIYHCKDSFKNKGVDANDYSKDFVMRTIIIEEQ